MKLLIENGTIVTMDHAGTIHEKTNLYIEGKKIIGIGLDPPPFTAPEADKVIDAANCYVLPGFVNAHGHLALGLFRGLGEFAPGLPWGDFFKRQGALAQGLAEEDYYFGAKLLIGEMLLAGITSFADIHQESPDSFPVTELIAQAVSETGMRAVLSLEANGYLNTGGSRLRYDQNEVDRTMENSLTFARKWHGSAQGRITVMLGLATPPAPMRYEMELLAQKATETDLPIQMHVAEVALEMKEWQSLYGKGPVQMLLETGLLEHHILGGNVIYLDADDALILKDYPFHASTCPQNCSKMCLGMLDIPLMLENGVNVCLGTNEVVTNNNLDMIEEMRYAALYHKMQRNDPAVLWGDEPLRLITERGGRALKLDVGVLEVGRPADVILMDVSGPHMHPAHDPIANLVFSSSAADTKTVIVDGRVVMEDRQIRTFDLDRVISDLKARLDPLRGDIPQLAPGDSQESFELFWEVER
jgi:5-methylthioadenosine/S-adenosylhomocysteine deaminase